jgi:hypothetical protein
MAVARAKVLHPNIRSGLAAAVPVDYLTYRDVVALVYETARHEARLAAIARLRRLRYNNRETWYWNHNVFEELADIIEQNPRDTYNSLTDFLTADSDVFNAVYGPPNQRDMDLKLASSVSHEEARPLYEELCSRGRRYHENITAEQRVRANADRKAGPHEASTPRQQQQQQQPRQQQQPKGSSSSRGSSTTRGQRGTRKHLPSGRSCQAVL